MPGDDGDARTLNVRPRSVLIAVGLIGLALVARNAFTRSSRVFGWLAAATVAAALVIPAVELLSRWMRRGIALLLVLVVVGGTIGFVTYVAVDDVRHEIDRLQEVAPDAAQRIEESDRYGDTAREFRLRERVQGFVDDLPGRLAGGGNAAAVIRSATTRGLAYLAGVILTIFLIFHGPRIVHGGIAQIGDPARRTRVERVMRRAYERSWTYLVGTLGLAIAAGVWAFAWCRAASLPGASVLGIFVALLSIIPYVGVMVGGLPVILLALGLKPGSWTVMLIAVLLLWQVFDAAVLRRQLVDRSIAIGPAVTTIIGALALDLYGIGGVLVGLAFAVYAIAVIDELAPTDADHLDVGVLTS
ncbi:MAG TPA: AI-2E family transporter [Acidimicrobiales bacterium]|jgi:predicted PurR-regulated permease PerM|nr:AI-2E family transporter [Acidimicrobiales bacterium]